MSKNPFISELFKFAYFPSHDQAISFLADNLVAKEDWDFSDSDSVNFGDFEVDIDQFKQGIKNGYVIDDNGNKRSIDKSTIKDILLSYKENY